MAIIDLNLEAHTLKMTMTKFGLVKICSAVSEEKIFKENSTDGWQMQSDGNNNSIDLAGGQYWSEMVDWYLMIIYMVFIITGRLLGSLY